jgi:hypothetical protein
MMAHLQQTQRTDQYFTFYFYELEIGPTLKVCSTPPNNVSIHQKQIITQNLSLFDRSIVYLSPQQQNRLPETIKSNKGLLNFLNACKYMIPADTLPTDMTIQDRSKHQYNNKVAFKLLKLSATQGFVPAQMMMSYCYNYGVEVKAKRDVAIEWLQKAAKQGNPKAVYELNTYFLHQIHNPYEATPLEIEIVKPWALPQTEPAIPSPSSTPSPSSSQSGQKKLTPEWDFIVSKIQSMEQKHEEAIRALQQSHESIIKVYEADADALRQTNHSLTERILFLENELNEARKNHEEKCESNKRVQSVQDNPPKRQKRAQRKENN